jgi:hypothetical protein
MHFMPIKPAFVLDLLSGRTIASSLSFSISVRPLTPYFRLLGDLFVDGFIPSERLCG